MNRNTFLALGLLTVCHSFGASATAINELSASITLKAPGNPATEHKLTSRPSTANSYELLCAEAALPLSILQKSHTDGAKELITTTLTAKEDVYFNLSFLLQTEFDHPQTQFYLPGFWYRQNLRSPHNAPSFHSSDSWIFREDRLSAPLSGAYNDRTGDFVTVIRKDDFRYEALSVHSAGEVIVSGKTSIGYTGFQNVNGKTALAFGFPSQEAPKTYIRKLTLAPSVIAFQSLKKGETIELCWEVRKANSKSFSDFIADAWTYTYDAYLPTAVNTPYSPSGMKKGLTGFFKESFVDKYPIKYTSGVHLRTDDCLSGSLAEVGFVGRVLLNAFNALEYGEQQGDATLVRNSNAIFDSYLQHGFTPSGFIREVVQCNSNTDDPTLSIRRQSEGVYALLYYLQYEKKQGRKHPEWEKKIVTMLQQLIKLQQEDGSFPRKFTDKMEIIDSSAGSTSTATPMLVLASIYFKDSSYLRCAKKTASYIEREIISKADYFSSTLDANCEDKEASFYATTALYHLALVTKKAESHRYRDLAKQSAYFCLSWYYVWDVPFAQGQMLGDIGLKTRGWGNVSVENNHIDVYAFDFTTILDWLATEYTEPRFSAFANVIRTSLCQLLPEEGHLCGVGKAGYYPEVVQHTHWDYGRNGKGFYNDIFAPGWTVASLWEMLTPERIQLFIKK